MDDSASSPNKHFGDAAFELNVSSLSCRTEVDHTKASSFKTGEPTEVLLQEFLDSSHIGEKNDLISLKVKSPGNETKVGERSSNFVSDFDQNEQDDSKANDQEYSYSGQLEVNKKKTLSKSATFPSSEDLLCVDGNGQLPNAEKESKYSSTPNTSVYTRSLSLPATSQLVSAMKGSRAQNGSSPTMKLSVKWAPDVYDPPVTLLSHTVKKSYNQRPRAKKKDSGKFKQNKGKSSRGNSDRSASHSNSSIKMAANVDTRSKAVVDRLIMTGYGNSNIGAPEYVGSSQDSKCGSSCLEGLAKMHISMGEAS